MQRLLLIGASLVLILGFSYELEAAKPMVLLHSKVATDGDFLVLPVQIAGKPYSFMVDTGAIISILDRSFLEDLEVFDESIAAVEVREGRKSKLYASPPITIRGTQSGTLSFPENSPVYCIDLSDARRVSDQQIDGILGMDFLAHYSLQLDLAAGELRLFDSKTLTDMPHEASLTIDMVEGKLADCDIVVYRPCLPIHTGRVSYWALIDTGSMWASLLIDQQARDALLERERLWEWSFILKDDGVTKVGTGDLATLRDLRLGPFTHYLLNAMGANPGCGLGIQYWRRYRATFDFPRQRLYLDKGPLFEMSDEAGHSGIFVGEVDGNEYKVVTQLMLGCFAQKNGVEIGDRLVSINGQNAKEMSVCHVLRRLSERREQVCELRLQRDGKEFSVTLPIVDKMPDLSKMP